MSSYHLNLFNGFELADADGGAIQIRSKKGRALLAYLVPSQGQQKPREELAALLWGDRGETQARRSLSQELYRLRALFPEEMQDGFILEAESVGLADGLFEVDVVRFERGLDAGDAEAAALYDGELLAGQEVSQESFDDWLRGERERVHDRAITGLHDLVRTRMDGPIEEALGSANRLLALDGSSEEAHRAVMRLHAGAGRRDLALKQYEKCRARLAEDLGVEPGGETDALYEEIKSSPPITPPQTASIEPHSTVREPTGKPSSIPAERRQITVLQCQIAISASSPDALDPEDRRDIVHVAWQACEEIVRRYEGAMMTPMDQSFLACFGFPEAHEDDAARAAYAALDIGETLQRMTLQQGLNMTVGIGIDSGLVIVGNSEGAGQTPTISGEAPNVASALMHRAGPGAVLVSEHTHKLLNTGFEMTELEQLAPHGLAGSARAWRVTGQRRVESRFEAGHPGALPGFVGRTEEVDILLRRWERATSGEGQVVLISGEPGIGKSRLTQILHERIAGETHTRILLQCSPHHTNSALYPISTQLELAAGIEPSESADDKLGKLESLLARSADEISPIAPLFADLLSIPYADHYPALNLTPQAQKARTLDALIAHLVGLANMEPILLIFEDLHWIDPTTQELLDMFVEHIQDARILALMTFRPEYQAPWVGQAHVAWMALNRLTRRESLELVQNVVAGADLDSATLDEVALKADGVPLFMEELTRALLEGGMQGAIPATLQASLLARFDRLGPAKEIAQVGAVIGREFSDRLVSAVSDLGELDLAEQLNVLTDSQLVFARGTPPDATYTFKHALVQDAAYESLLRPRRKALHARVAEVLDTHSPDIVDTRPELLAHHHTEAGSIGPAVDLWHKAARQALERSSYFEAANHARSGLGIVGDLPADDQRPRRQLDLQSCLATALAPTKGYADRQTGEAFQRARELCELVDDVEAIFPVYLGLHAFHVARGEYDISSEIAATSLKRAERVPTAQPMIFSLYVSGFDSWWFGRLLTALNFYEKMIALEEREKPEPVAAQYGEEPALGGRWAMALVLWNLGYPDRALKISDDALKSARELAHANTLAMGLQWSCTLRQYRCDREPLAQFVEELSAFSEEQRLSQWHTWGRIYKSISAIAMGNNELAPMREAIEDSRRIGLVFRLYFLTCYADGCRKLGEVDEGHDALDQAMETHAETGEAWWLPETHRVRGDLFLAADRPSESEAEAAYSSALEIARDQEAKSLELRTAHNLARLWHGQGKSGKARDLLAPIYDWFTEGFDTVDLKEAKALLDELG